jgi:RNA polymerase sigma-70 factor, ECF subfamily
MYYFDEWIFFYNEWNFILHEQHISNDSVYYTFLYLYIYRKSISGNHWKLGSYKIMQFLFKKSVIFFGSVIYLYYICSVVLIVSLIQKAMTTKYNKSAIMKKAWQIFKSQSVRTNEMFSNCLKESWSNAKGIETKSVPVIDFAKVRKDILTFVNWKLGNKIDDAEDLTQDALIKVYSNLSSFNETKGNFRNWYLIIADHCIKDFFRSNKERFADVSISDYLNENGSKKLQISDNKETDNEMTNKELSVELKKAIHTLKPEYKRIMLLRFVMKMEYREIADYCEISIGNVESLIYRAKKILQKQLAIA